MSEKKVLHVVNISFVLPYFIGNQFDYFRNRGWKFFVACQPSDHFFRYASSKDFVPYPVNISRSINPVADCIAIYKIFRMIKSENLKFVIGHTPKGGLVAMLAAWLARVPNRVYFRHGVMFETSRGLKRRILVFIERLTARLATQVVCVSPSVLQVSEEQKLSVASKNILLHKGTCNGIDINRFDIDTVDMQQVNRLKRKHRIEAGDRVVGYVGRLVKDKGIIELVTAWQEIVRLHKKVKLLLVGPFEERDALPRELKESILSSDNIIYTDLVEDTVPFYAMMDIFILPSYREGFPTVVLEASSMGLPSLTSRATGCVDSIIEAVSGMYIDLTPQSIRDGILYYLEHPGIARQHGQNGRALVVNNFSQDLIWGEIEKKILTADCT